MSGVEVNSFLAWLKSLLEPKPPAKVEAEVEAAKTAYTHMHPLDWIRNEARTLNGVKEIAGSKDNPRIVWYLKACGNIGGERKNHHDEVPWCSALPNRAAMECGCEKTDNALASSWDKYPGRKFKKGDRIPKGAIVRIAHPGGHVTLADEEFTWTGKGSFLGCGGNQGNMIRVSPYQQADIITIHDWCPKKGTVLAPIRSASLGVSGRAGESTR